MVEFRATTQNFSEPTKELDAAMQAGRIRHCGDPVLEWCLGNVVGRFDARSNVYPRKARDENTECRHAFRTQSAYLQWLWFISV